MVTGERDDPGRRWTGCEPALPAAARRRQPALGRELPLHQDRRPPAQPGDADPRPARPRDGRARRDRAGARRAWGDALGASCERALARDRRPRERRDPLLAPLLGREADRLGARVDHPGGGADLQRRRRDRLRRRRAPRRRATARQGPRRARRVRDGALLRGRATARGALPGRPRAAGGRARDDRDRRASGGTGGNRRGAATPALLEDDRLDRHARGAADGRRLPALLRDHRRRGRRVCVARDLPRPADRPRLRLRLPRRALRRRCVRGARADPRRRRARDRSGPAAAAPALASLAGVSRRYALYLFVLGAIWGSSYLFIKVGVRDLSPAVLIEIRLLCAAPVLVAFAARRYGRHALRGAWRQGLVLGVLNAA